MRYKAAFLFESRKLYKNPLWTNENIHSINSSEENIQEWNIFGEDITANISRPLYLKKANCCSYCNKMFATSWHLQRHVRSHKGDKPFICQVCNKSFVEKSNMMKHFFRMHKGHMI